MSLEHIVEHYKEMLAYAHHVQSVLRDRVTGRTLPQGFRNEIAVACLDQAIEHARAILLLVSPPAPVTAMGGAAAALIRSCFESMTRGCWFAFAATPDQLRRCQELGKTAFKHESMPGPISEKQPDIGNVITRRIKELDAMHWYAHGDIPHVIGRITLGRVGAVNNPAEMTEVLAVSCESALVAGCAISRICNDDAVGAVCRDGLAALYEILGRSPRG